MLGIGILTVLASHAQASRIQAAAETATEHELDVASFEQVWQAIRDTHWEDMPGGLDWDAVHEEFAPRVEAAANRDEVREILAEMLRRIGQTHFGIIPATVYSSLDTGSGGEYDTGISLRVLGDRAVVTEVNEGSPAAAAGVRPGWILDRLGDRPVQEVIGRVREDPRTNGMQLGLYLTAVLQRGLTGAPGSTVSATFLDGADDPVALELGVAEPRGVMSEFANLPPSPVWYEEKRFGDTTYVRFNAFLDLPRVMTSFGESIHDCAPCSGVIIDVRGNGGGIGAMAMGMSGFLISEPNLRLGTMHMRDVDLSFVVNPRPNAFEGPVAILTDSGSASTAEIFAGGLQDLGRARVFGTRSAAAALPAAIERLPNGDGFMHAIANYVSASGRQLEGHGVIPDETVRLDREALLAGRDPVIEAALDWIEGQAP